ncbi:MAG: RNA polymerase sigma factor [Acidimicrobiia bacterium]
MAEPRVESHEVARLVDLARQGDRDAFGMLVHLHQNEVYTLALRLTANPDMAADVAQEAFVRAWRAIPRFRGDAAFSTWLHRITVNVAWTLRKRKKRHESQPLTEAMDLADTHEHLAPERAGELLELRQSIKVALARLPAGQRAVVVLKDVYGWSHAEVGEALGISVAAAKVRLHRGHKLLRKYLEVERES